MNKMKLYNNMPRSLQNIACSIEGFRIQRARYGKLFEQAYEDYMSRNTWTYEQLCEYRDVQLRKIVQHCFETVPYYNKMFKDYGIDYKRIKTLDDLKLLPKINKQIVKDNFKDFISESVNTKDLIISHTSGTTGSGFEFYSTKKADALRWADAWRGYSNLGISMGIWRAYFGGNSIVPKEIISPPYHRVNLPGKQILFSIYHMNDTTLDSYISILDKLKPIWIQGYPSAISLLAQYMNENNISLSYDVGFVTLGSENLTDIQVNNINKAFGVKPYQNYGQAECVAVFRENIEHKIFVSEDIAAVEFEKNKCDQNYKIIGTTLTNYAMPFLRYETGDLATYKETNDGRQITSLDGRSEDYITLKDNSKVGRIAHIFTDMVNIKEAQILQNTIGKAYIHVVKGNNYSTSDENKLLNRFSERFGDKLDIEIKYEEKINRTKNGKLRFIISSLSKFEKEE